MSHFQFNLPKSRDQQNKRVSDERQGTEFVGLAKALGTEGGLRTNITSATLARRIRFPYCGHEINPSYLGIQLLS
ncbi:hypothetical protein SAMN05216406_101162 [Nitrosomonas ureae]|uniref:Uncharacterized protein n=1 Tax=Nitrosomonas ureae TaxID=44577 RepID=A0A1H2DN75_9PROT|nr:hypothetical protein SAMN05216406_101162 [Nitrosomonas ureae]